MIVSLHFFVIIVPSYLYKKTRRKKGERNFEIPEGGITGDSWSRSIGGSPIVAVGLKFLSEVCGQPFEARVGMCTRLPGRCFGETGRAFIRSGTYIRNLGVLNFLGKKNKAGQDLLLSTNLIKF